MTFKCRSPLHLFSSYTRIIFCHYISFLLSFPTVFPSSLLLGTLPSPQQDSLLYYPLLVKLTFFYIFTSLWNLWIQRKWLSCPWFNSLIMHIVGIKVLNIKQYEWRLSKECLFYVQKQYIEDFTHFSPLCGERTEWEAWRWVLTDSTYMSKVKTAVYNVSWGSTGISTGDSEYVWKSGCSSHIQATPFIFGSSKSFSLSQHLLWFPPYLPNIQHTQQMEKESIEW